MTALLSVLGAAALFAVFGLVSREARRSGGVGAGACPADSGGCNGCPSNPTVESEHAQR